MPPFLRAPPILFRRRWRRIPPNARGISLVVIDSLVIAVMTMVVKLMGAAYHAFELSFFRAAMGLVLLIPLMIAQGGAAFRTRRLPMHSLRVLLGGGSLICGYYAVVELTLADATSIGFTRPMIMMIFAVLFLGEIVGWRRWSAVAVGFMGVLVMMRPGGAAFDPAMLVALFGAVLACGTVVVVKKLTVTESTAALMVWSAILTTVMTAIPAIPVWRAPQIEHWPLILVIGMLGIFGQFCFLRAYEDGSPR